uniref:Uncharacterized protein n=1 Tax=Strigamia maritima TaxID=126957 RepID=T1J0I2_STRMM
MATEGLDKNEMRKVDLKLDMPQIKNAEIEFMKRIEMQNLQRVEKLRKMNRKSNVTGGLILSDSVMFHPQFHARIK